MKCNACGQTNNEWRKFCGECGAPLAVTCRACGVANEDGGKFCGNCGAEFQPSAKKSDFQASRASPAGTLAQDVSPRQSRKIVSIVFADLAGSTALHERLDPESARVFMEKYYQAMRGAVASHDGTIIKFLGDGVMAAFGVPRVSEDDALRSVRAGMAMQEAFAELAREKLDELGELGLRVGINTGEVVVSSGNTDIVGDPVNVTARLQQEARNGDVIIGESTQRLVGSWVTLMPLGRFALKGRSGGVKAFSVVSLDPPASAATAVFVGREEELGRLHSMFEAAVNDATVRLAVLVGSPGLGKSRLVEEFCHRLGDGATILRAHCDADTGATFVPLVRALREFFQLDSRAAESEVETSIAQALPEGDADHARISRGIAGFLTGSVATPEETFFILRRLLGALANDRPAVLVLDDVHWAESLLLEFIEHLVQWGSGLRLFVLLGARPEIREVRSSLVTPGGPVTEVVTLSGLDAGAAMRLAANTIGATDLPASLAAKVLATSEGNPLFLGELVRMLVDEGVIERKGDRWVVGAALETLEMPPTIHALLAARIERLRPEELALLERASVMGRQFSRGAVAELMPGSAKDLDAQLESLRRAELIERDTGWFLGEPVLRFHHVLIRDAAYRRLLKGTRAELHARLAAWIESKAEDLTEHEEILGWHLEQAHELLGELGPLDSKGRELGQRASRHLASAGRHALALDDVALAANLLGRAIDRLDHDDPARPDLALDVCEALLAEGDVKRAAEAIEVLEQASGDSARLKAWHTCFAGQLTVMTKPKGLQATAEQVASAALELAALEDAAGEAKAHFVAAQALARLGKVGACEAALDPALAAARRAGDRRRANAVLAGAPLAALWGPSPVTRASGRCLDVVRVLRITQGAPAVEAVALSCQGLLEALRGRTDAARRMVGSARKMVEELGITHRLLETDIFTGRIDLLEGDAAGAEQRFRAGFEGLRELGHGIDAARAAALFGRALLAQDRVDEAEVTSQESEKLAGDDLQASIAWRVVRARALAQRGNVEAAIEVARKAVDIAAATDALLDHADARLALAIALRAAGRNAEGAEEERRAFGLWEEKGATVLIERSRAAEILPELSAEPSEAEKPEAGPIRRRIRPNAAVDHTGRVVEAVRSADLDTLETLSRPDLEVVHHPTGSTYGGDTLQGLWRSLFRARNPSIEEQPLATLGESLALVRRHVRHEGDDTKIGSLGPVEFEQVILIEVDEQERARRYEIFDADRLTSAIARLYERFAERMPEGPERKLAEAIAYTFSVWLLENPLYNLEGAGEGGWDACVVDPEFELIDHRAIGMHAIRGPGELDTFLKAVTDFEAATSFHQDLMALNRDTLLFKYVKTGTARDGGGPFERRLLVLLQVNSQGKMARTEVFDFEDEAGAFARFEALAAGATLRPSIRRRVRANTALRNVEKADAALHAGDMAAIDSLFDPSLEMIHHPTGAVAGREAMPAMWRALSRMKNAVIENEPLATLGDSLALCRRLIHHEGGDTKIGSLGPAEEEAFLVTEVDDSGKAIRFEIFDAAHLSSAIACLYERYAVRMDGGPEKHRAAGTARSFAGLTGQAEILRIEASLSPDYVNVDHRSLGTWSTPSPQAMVDHFRHQQELAEGFSSRDDDVLALEAQACLLHRTYYGEARASGGHFENPLILLFEFAPDGRVGRHEVWDPEQEAEALTRFEELIPARDKPERAERRVRGNAAVEHVERLHDAILNRDPEALKELLAAEFTVIDHPNGTSYGSEGLVKTWKLAFGAKNLRCEQTPLATIGEAMVLFRQLIAIEAFEQGALAPSGPIELDTFLVVQVDDDGKCVWAEVFAGDRLSHAIARLFERYAEIMPEGPEKDRAAGRSRTFSVSYGPIDPEKIATTLQPSFELRDHRTLSTWNSRNPEELIDHYRAQNELVSGFAARDEDVLALDDDAYLLRRTYYGTAREGGGGFENKILMLVLIGEDGRSTWSEIWDAEQEAEALARFDVLCEQGKPIVDSTTDSSSFDNSAALADERLMSRFNARNWDGVLACIAPEVVFDERRRLVRNKAEKEVWLEQFRLMYDLPESRFTIRLLATRGDRLSLHRHEFTSHVADGGGPLEMEPHMTLHEVDEQGRIAAIVLFDLEEVDAAYAELDARYEKGEGAHAPGWRLTRRMLDSIYRRDREAFRSCCAPRWHVRDHRTLGFGETLNNVETFLDAQDSLLDLSPDARHRIEHFEATNRATLVQVTLHGTREGGRFETPFVFAGGLDDRGRVVDMEIHEIENIADARARYKALNRGDSTIDSLPDPSPRFENEALRSIRQFTLSWRNRDWEKLARPLAQSYRYIDRRRMAQLELSREEYVAFTREFAGDRAIRSELKVLATRGERLALFRLSAEVTGGDVGPSELEHLNVIESDEQGLIVEQVRFDADDLDAAFAELDARYESGKGARGEGWRTTQMIYNSIYRRDREAFLGCFAPGFHVRDHRLLGWGSTLGDRETFYEAQEAMLDLSPDFRYRVDHFEMTELAYIGQVAQVGTREGGAFENRFIYVGLHDGEGRMAEMDVYGLEQIDAARARYAKLNAGTTQPGSPWASRLLFENAATRCTQRFTECWLRNDPEGLAGTMAENFRCSVRQSMAQIELWRDEYVPFVLELRKGRSAEGGPQFLATRGERFALYRLLVRIEGGDVGPSELEHLCVVEVDERGLQLKQVRFDPEDLNAAVSELDARYEKTQPAHGSPWRVYRQTMDAIYRRDRETALSLQSPDLKVVDHRVLGWGETLTSPEIFYDSQIALLDLAPDFRMRFDHFEVTGRAVLAQLAQVGTREGGPFESPFFLVGGVDRDGRFVTVDIYGLDRVEAARARYEALKRRPPKANSSGSEEVFANAAFRNAERCIQGWTEGDYTRVSALVRPDYVVSDRRKSVQLELDRESTVKFSRIYREMEIKRVDVKLIATRGDRLSLDLTRVELADPDVASAETVYLNLQEVDEQGLATFSVRWDEDDLDAAFAELDARYEAGEGKSHPEGWSIIHNFSHAVSHRQWDDVEAMCAPEFVEFDHRPFAILGTTKGGDQWVKNFTTLVGLATDTVYRTEHFRGCRRGFFSIGKWYGTNEGGDFEIPLLPVGELNDQGHIIRIDLFDPDRSEEAWARFEEIESSAGSVAEPSIAESPFANSASRACERLGRLFVGDQGFSEEGQRHFRSLVTPDYVYSVRRKAVLLDLGVQETIEYNRSVMDMANRRLSSVLLATRGERLALLRTRFEVSDDVVGPSEFNHLSLYEMDEQGLIRQMVCWDEDDLDAAYAQLDARYEALESGAGRRAWDIDRKFVRAINSGDWVLAATFLSPDVSEHDRRNFAVLGTTRGAEALITNFRNLSELSPDSRFRTNHFIAGERCYITSGGFFGTRDGGDWEIPLLVLVELNEAGLFVRTHLYDLDQLHEAEARFEGIESTPAAGASSVPPESVFANAASRACDKLSAAFRDGTVNRLRPVMSQDFRFSDRRKAVQLELGYEETVKFTQAIETMENRSIHAELLATRGDRLALLRLRTNVADDLVGPTEFHHLNLYEVNDQGLLKAVVRWEEDDLDAAYAELDARYETMEAAEDPDFVSLGLSFREAFRTGQFEAVLQRCSPDFVRFDHRPLAVLGTAHGAEAWLQEMASLMELAPDAVLRGHHVRRENRASLTVATWYGTREGGNFEIPIVLVLEADAETQLVRADLYDPEQIDQALARFEELKSSELLHLRMPPYIDGRANPVLKAWRAWLTALDAGLNGDDWEPVRAITSPKVRFEDRQRRALVSGDREMMIESLRARKAQDARVEASLLGMAGDRVAAVRMLWSGGPLNGRFEIEYNGLIEIDENGLLTATILFDADALHDFQHEMWDRWATIDPSSRRLTRALDIYAGAFRDRDSERLRASVADDVQVDDHRRMGMGPIEGAEACVRSAQALWELSESARPHLGWFWLAHAGSLGLTVAGLHGANADGGEFETEFLLLIAESEGRLSRIEFFEMDAMELALARFEELRPDPLRIPPNAAVRAVRKIGECRAKQDLELLRSLVAPDFSFDDRKKRSLVRGGVDEWIRALAFLWEETDARPQDRLIATMGDRLALHRVAWREAPGNSGFIIENYRLVEVDADGLIRALILFDADDLDAARSELGNCFLDQVRADHPEVAPFLTDLLSAGADARWSRLTQYFSPDFMRYDHRPPAVLGNIQGGEYWIQELNTLAEIAPDVTFDTEHVRLTSNGSLAVGAWRGTQEGGKFEIPLVPVFEWNEAGLILQIDIYEPEQLDQAMERLAATEKHKPLTQI